MICPVCHKTAISLGRFAFMFNPRSLYCDHCGKELQMSQQSWRAWLAWLVIGAVIVLVSIVVRRIVGWGLLTNLVGIIILAAILSWHFWRTAVYQVKQQDTP